MRMCHNRTLPVGLPVPAAVSLGLAGAAMLLFVAACTQATAQTPQPAKCPYIGSTDALANCRRLADAGSTEAMLTLAEGYTQGFTFIEGRFFSGPEVIKVPPDRTESQRYYTLAANLGDNKALRHVFEEYYFGRTIPKNNAIAEQYLNKAAQFGSEWAILLLAQGQEKLAPGKALEAYLRLARNDNCVAQLRLAQAYASGVLVKTNLTQAYFWALLAKANSSARRADLEYLGEGMRYEAGYGKECFLAAALSGVTVEVQIKVEKVLSAKLVQAAQDAATNWTKGEPEKLLPAPVITATLAVPPGARSNEPPKTATIASPSEPKYSALPPERKPEEHDPWEHFAPAQQPAAPPKLAKPSPAPRPAIQTAIWTQLSKDARPPQLRNKQSAEELFAKARSSVWVVIATQSVSQSDATSLISQGSAVAITRSRLLTNYHVVEGQRFVFVKQGDNVIEATVVAGDKEGDRCVLAVKGEPLVPVDGLRGFGELRVGEQVYTIGSPSALESTLGQGIVSGLRTVAGRQLVQTTAPISPGSSGGGLFDSAGNLVGITSFMLKNSQGLNFAIAAEDYFR